MSWRDRLIPASFNGVSFHVESKGRESGRRTVLHEFPNRDTPYTEDLGRRARTTHVSGYVIGDNYDARMLALIAACEARGPGLLILPTYGPQLVMCDFVGASESRQEGGYGVLEMDFIEAGSRPGSGAPASLPATISAASGLASAARSALSILVAVF